MTEINAAEPTIVKKRALSAIWFLPLLALLLGSWLLYKHFSDAGTQITIHFDNANGILAGKTKIRYQGLVVATVKDIVLDEDVSGVYILTEIDKQAAHLLKTDTQFWLVSPKATLSGISGLDTLFTGNYINMSPGEGEESRRFIAKDQAPRLKSRDGLLVKLRAIDMGSINLGSPVYYKKIPVGEVHDFRLLTDGQEVEIQLVVESRYANLVKQSSRFWNVSGISADFSLSGLKVHTESLASIISGAIAFDSPKDGIEAPQDFMFHFYPNIDDAGRGVEITLKTASTLGLSTGAPILFKGLKIGKVVNLSYDKDNNIFIAKAVVEPMFTDQLTDNSTFWVEKTEVGFTGIKNLGNLLTGNFISFRPAAGKPQRTFNLLDNLSDGLEKVKVKLIADSAAGLKSGAGIYYKKLLVGEITNLELDHQHHWVNVTVHVGAQYSHLIARSTRFYKHSGFRVKASLQGVEVNADPLTELLQGGVSFYNPDDKVRGNKQKRYRLYPDFSLAEIGYKAFEKPVTVQLVSDEMTSVTQGSPVYYHKLPVGKVDSYRLDSKGKIKLSLHIEGEYSHLITKNSVFWDVSGIKIKGGLSGIEVETGSLLSIAAGGIAFDNLTGAKKPARSLYPLYKSYREATEISKTITISFQQAENIKIGTELKHKGLTIGNVTELSLNNKSARVDAKAKIYQPYMAQFAKQGARFWLVTADISLDGAKHLDTILSGAFINTLPGKGKTATQFNGLSTSPLLAQDELGLTLTLITHRAGSLRPGSPVYYRQVKVGSVIDFALSKLSDKVEISVNIEPDYRHLVRQNSVFWMVSGFNMEVGLTGAALKAESLEAILKGGVSFNTPDDKKVQARAKEHTQFPIHSEFKQSWLNWKAKIPNEA